MEVLPGAIKLPDAVAHRLHAGVDTSYFGHVRLEGLWRIRSRECCAVAAGAALATLASLALGTAGPAGIAVLAIAVAAGSWLRSRSYGRKASAA